MRIIFMGTPEFALPSLKALHQAPNHEVVAVVTATDKWGGRGGKQLLESEIKKYAVEQGIPVLQPEKLKNPEFIAQLQSYQADLQVVVAFRMLPEVVWNMPKMGTLNLHGSLLPQLRGAAPLNWALMRGLPETGLTTFLLQHEIDTGDVLMQYRTDIDPDETVGELHDRLMLEGGKLVLDTVNALEQGSLQPKPQDNSLVSSAPKIFHETCQINWEQNATQVHNFIRGLSPYPTAWTQENDLKIKVFRSKRVEENLDFPSDMPQGLFFPWKKRLFVRCAENTYLEILELQPEKRKRITAKDYLNSLK